MKQSEIRERQALVAEYTRAGWSAPAIAGVLGISVRQVQRDRFAAKVSQPYSVMMSESEISRASALLADGCSYMEVARTVGRDRSTLRRQFPGHGWSPSMCGSFSKANSRLGVSL